MSGVEYVQDLDTADISSRVHNTRPVQQKEYSPLSSSLATAARRRSPQKQGENERRSLNDKKKVSRDGKKDDMRSNEKVDVDEKGEGNDIVLLPEEDRNNKHDVVWEKEESKSPNDEAVLFEESLVQKTKKIFEKLSRKMETSFDREDKAKIISCLLMKLRKQFALDDSILEECYRWGILTLVLSNSEKIFNFAFVVEEVFNCILPIVRFPSLKSKASNNLLKLGGLIFTMTAIRMFHQSNSNIRLLSLELLEIILRYVQYCNSSSGQKMNVKTKKHTSKSYIVHHMLLHGAASSLPRLLSNFIQSSSEISAWRTLKCLTFLLAETPSDMSVTVAMNNRWTMLRDLLHCIRNFNAEVKVASAVLLTGLIASSAVVAEKLIEMQAWDDLSTCLVNPDLDFSDMPTAWLEKSMETMKLMQSRNIKSHIEIPQETLSKRFDGLNFDESQDTFDIDKLIEGAHRESSSPNDSKGYIAQLNSSFWPQPNPSVMRDEVDISRTPSMKKRLETSPFGDPKKILQYNERMKETHKENQRKVRKGTSRLLKSPHPRKTLRDSQRKYFSKSSKRESTSYSENATVPIDTVERVEVAEKLFADVTNSVSRPSSATNKGDDFNANTTESYQEKKASGNRIDNLTYAEKLQVMILHCQEAYQSCQDRLDIEE